MSIANMIRRMGEAGIPAAEIIKRAIHAAEEQEAPRVIRVDGRVKRMCGRAKKTKFEALSKIHGAKCAICGMAHKTIWRRMGIWTHAVDGGRYTKVHPTSNLEVDHRLPLSEGGDNSIPNLWLLCIDCHKQKTSLERSDRLKRLFRAARP